MATDIPKYDDPYVGPVYGNVLDNFANSTYYAKLYMLRSSLSLAAHSGVASMDPSLTGPPGDQVILAQTGVTAATIDDITIESLTATDGPNAIELKFTIKQPGAATFLDQMALSRLYLDQKNTAIPVVFLEIGFKGYTGDYEDEDSEESGKFESDIAGPYRWKLHITDVSVEVNQGGSSYDFTAIPSKSYSFTSPLFKLPTNFASVGKTITEHVTSLQEQLNTYHKDVPDHDVADEFEFDLTGLIGSESNEDGTNKAGKITNEDLYTSADQDADDRNRLLNETYAIGDAVEGRQAFVDAPLDEGEEPEQVFDQDKIMVPKDITIEKYFAILLSMNDEFHQKISRKETLDDPASEIKKGEAYVYWFKMTANLEQLGWDKKRNKYGHKVTFKPVLYKSSRDDIVVDAKEAEVPQKDYESRAQQIVDSGGLKKAYNYIFTGLNDQIKSLDIKYDSGIALILPPSGGAIGSAAVVLAEKAGTIKADEDVTLDGVVENLIEAKKNESLADSFKNFMDSLSKLKDVAESGLSGFVDQLTDATGLDIDIITGALRDGNEANQQALSDALDVKQLQDIKKQNEINNPSVESFTEYTANVSQYNYAVDLTNSMEQSNSLTADQLENLGYLTVDEVQEAGELLPKTTVTDASGKEPGSDAATIKKGSVSNTLFGFIAGQHQADLAFMLELDMTLRGDPWYLGNDGDKSSNEAQANYYGDDNHLYLTLRSPKTFDLDWRDEDSDINTGYWRGDGLSRSFGGVYRLISVVNSFSGGEYTCEVNAQRIVPPITSKPKAVTDMENAKNFSGQIFGKIYSDGLDGAPPRGYYNKYQMDYWQANSSIPPTTQDPGQE
jgi:hypothetical protein